MPSTSGRGQREDPGFINPASPVYNSNPIYTFRDMVTKIAGNHNLTFGADFIAYQKNEQGTPDVQGFATFSSADSAISTGNGFADFLLGRMANFSQTSFQAKFYHRYKTLGPYIQDDWHVSHRLTLNLGFRMEMMGAFYPRFHHEYNFEQAAWNPADVPTLDVDGSITGQAGALVPAWNNIRLERKRGSRL